VTTIAPQWLEQSLATSPSSRKPPRLPPGVNGDELIAALVEEQTACEFRESKCRGPK
jgi:hypothetical protein